MASVTTLLLKQFGKISINGPIKNCPTKLSTKSSVSRLYSSSSSSSSQLSSRINIKNNQCTVPYFTTLFQSHTKALSVLGCNTTEWVKTSYSDNKKHNNTCCGFQKGWERGFFTTTFDKPKVIVDATESYGTPHNKRSSSNPLFEISTQKLKPYIVKRRLNRMKTYVGTEKNIRHSQWRLNLVCQFAAGLPLQEALLQLQFCKKGKASLVQKVLKRTSNLADIRDGLQMSQLEVAECFATKGTPLKRLKIMGRGRAGLKERGFSHFRVILREIDFKLKLYQAKTIGQKKRWYYLQQRAIEDAAKAKAERDEINRMEQQTARYAAAAAAAAAKGK